VEFTKKTNCVTRSENHTLSSKPVTNQNLAKMGPAAHDRSSRSSAKEMPCISCPHVLSHLVAVWCLLGAAFALGLVGCGQPPSPQAAGQEQTKSAQPAVPTDIQATAEKLLGGETDVLAFGDLAKNGKQQFLAANIVPKTPKNDIPGTIVTRAVIAEKEGDTWNELFRCDEHLKNPKGYLGLSPLEPVTGWRLQFEQDPEKGLALYLTPVQGMSDRHVLPIGVRWNPETKRYQSLDRSYEHFLPESPTLGTLRSMLQ
jgi:hypothetical protein